MHNAFINSESKIGVNCIVNTGAVIEHNVTIGQHTNASINGEGSIGEHVFIGSMSCISSGVSFGNHVIIGAGSTSIHDISEPGTYVVSPLKRVK